MSSSYIIAEEENIIFDLDFQIECNHECQSNRLEEKMIEKIKK